MAHMPEIIILRKTEETKTGVAYGIAKVKTNADRIRAMSDEELAEYLHYICDQYYEPDNGWLDWLKKSDASPFEVEE